MIDMVKARWIACQSGNSDGAEMLTDALDEIDKLREVATAAMVVDRWMRKYGTAPCSVEEAANLTRALRAAGYAPTELPILIDPGEDPSVLAARHE